MGSVVAIVPGPFSMGAGEHSEGCRAYWTGRCHFCPLQAPRRARLDAVSHVTAGRAGRPQRTHSGRRGAGPSWRPWCSRWRRWRWGNRERREGEGERAARRVGIEGDGSRELAVARQPGPGRPSMLPAPSLPGPVAPAMLLPTSPCKPSETTPIQRC